MATATAVATVITIGIGIAGPEASESAQGLDPVVVDVIRLVGEGVPADTVVEWLGQSGRTPGPLSAEDLLALHRVDVPEEVIRRLLEMASREGTVDSVGTSDPDRLATVDFVVAYRSEVQEQLEEWHLYVYVDGLPIVWSPGEMHPHLARALRFTRDLSPGVHVVRLVQEKHVEQALGKDGWRHQARVCPEPLALDLDTGARWQVELTVSEVGGVGWRNPGSVKWRVLRDGSVTDEVSGVGGHTVDWPPLCDEVLTRLDPEKQDTAAGRRALDGCVSWESLWPGMDAVPGRDEVRTLLESFRFRPAMGEAE